MIVQYDTRSVLNAFYRQGWKFLLVFLPVFLGGILYVFLATPEYESTAKLLFKFGQDSLPVSRSQAADSQTSVDAHRELVQSNVAILTSHDSIEAILRDTTIERVYPSLVRNPPEHGTVMDAAIKRFMDDLIIKTENDTDIINVGLYNPDPEMAQAMVKRLIDLFITRQSEVYSNPQTNLLAEQAQAAHAKLEDAQKRLYDYKKKAGFSSIDDEVTLLLKQRSDLVAQRFAKERSNDQYQFVVAGNEPQDLDVQALKQQISQLDRKIYSLSQHKSQYEDLAREIQMDEDDYKTKQSRLDDAEVSQSLNQQKITRLSVIERPTLPYKSTRPWKAAVLVFSFLIGLSLAISTCIIAESFDQRFSYPEQAAAALGVPVLVSFAYRSRAARARLQKEARKRSRAAS